MKKFLVLAGFGAMLAGCAANGQLSPDAQAAVVKLCAQDAADQPVAVADLAELQLITGLAGLAIPPAAVVNNDVGQAISLDQTLIHPLVQQVCQKLAPPAAS